MALDCGGEGVGQVPLNHLLLPLPPLPPPMFLSAQFVSLLVALVSMIVQHLSPHTPLFRLAVQFFIHHRIAGGGVGDLCPFVFYTGRVVAGQEGEIPNEENNHGEENKL